MTVTLTTPISSVALIASTAPDVDVQGAVGDVSELSSAVKDVGRVVKHAFGAVI